MITAPMLEIGVLVLGMVILMVEAFATKIDKRILAFAAMSALAIVLLASFFVVPFPSPTYATGFWNFYTADRLAIFFKQFAVVTTIFVLIMMIDYAPVVRSSFPATQDGIGEFFALPIFTCVGLMYLVSAIDFVFIFVSLELVTISFYVLVSFTRRNPITLEAGIKYLVLSALSTAFLVYGIAWIFGVTGQTNLQRLLAYSSIAHAGYLLIGVACFDGRAVSFYLAAYLLMTLLSFAVLIIVAQQTGEQISDFDGLAKRSPFLAFAMLIGMVSLAGVPFTPGFLGKFFIFYAAILQRQIALVVIGVITVGCGFYYYLKVVRAMYWQPANKAENIPISGLSRLAIGALIAATIWLGVYPQPILDALKR